MNKKITVKIVAEMLGIDIRTLRRWNSKGFLKYESHKGTHNRYYLEEKIEDFLVNNYKYLEKTCRKWAFGDAPVIELVPIFHCSDKSIFKARLSKLESLLAKDEYLGIDYKFSLIIAIVGEIGNNSFDHNIGKWADERGIFFGYSLTERKIILADRGQGLLSTLKRVKTELSTHKDALRVAFTEYITGRAPESRGNGLKYVKKIVEGMKEEVKDLNLNFQSGDAEAFIRHGDNSLDIKNTKNSNRGCFVLLSY